MKLLATILIFIVFTNCNSNNIEEHKHPDGNYISEIIIPAGDEFSFLRNNGVPSFFNIGEIQVDQGDVHKTIIIGKRRNKKDQINIEPIALFSFVKDTISFRYIVSLSEDEPLDGIGRNFNSFSLNNYHLQSSIEEWFKSQCLVGECRDFKWENSYKALLEMSKQSNK